MATVQSSGAAVAQELVVDLADAASREPLVGGKGAGLGWLIGAGMPVPAGFCVTTAAYEQVAAAGVAAVLRDAGAGTDGAGVNGAGVNGAGEGGAALAAAAREAVLAAPVPAGIATAVTSAYRALGVDVPVAVRSSATAEDLPTASFAGQQDTYLHVVGADAVLDAVRYCWASLWTDRAVSYRASQGIDHRGVALAVVVQRMVDASVAGVLFTADPVTGCRTRSVVDASPGLGEAVVSGAVNPDHFVVDRGGRVVERSPGDKRVAVRPVPGGGTELVRTEGTDDLCLTGDFCLTDEQLRALVELGARVEHHAGAPQDIEWALDAAGALWLTQSRPITTLYPLPATAAPEPTRAYLCFSLAQGLTRPITPMGMAAFRLLGSCGARVLFGLRVAEPRDGPPALVEAGRRAFVDITPVLRSHPGRLLVPRILDVMEARSAVVLRALVEDPRFAGPATGWWPVLRRLAAVALRFRIPLQITQAMASPAAARRRVARFAERLAATLTVPEGADVLGRLDHVERVLGTAVLPIMPSVTPVAGSGFLSQALAGRLAGDALVPERDEVLRSLPHNVTTEMDLALWELATRVAADPDSAAALRAGAAPAELATRFHGRALPAVLQHGLGAFLREHGHRAVAEIDVGMPRWSDDPTHVLGVLANYLRLDDPELGPAAQFARGRQAAEQAVERVVGAVRRRSRWRAAVVRLALRRVRELVGMRETHKDLLVRALAHVRGQLAVVGAELAAAGRLADPEDVFFLDLAEVRAALAGTDQRDRVARRREDYARELRRGRVPRVMLSDGTVPEDAQPRRAPRDGTVRDTAAGHGAEAERLVGTPASAGTVTGTARVVLDPVGAHLEPGEILVAPSTDPGWTPLFLTAGGLVMEMGGANSHGSVVAREYGIPAVVGVPDATAHIGTGRRITVQGAAGEVWLH